MRECLKERIKKIEKKTAKIRITRSFAKVYLNLGSSRTHTEKSKR
jgi:hypothetical protein